MRCLAVLLVVLSSLAAASSGGDEYVAGLCLDASGKRILYSHGDHSESGLVDGLMAIDLATGKKTELIAQGLPDEQPSAEPHLKGCTPLQAAKLSDVGLTAEVRLPKQVPLTFDAKNLPEDFFLFRPMHPYLLSISARGKPLFSETFVACWGQTAPANLFAHHLPGHRFVAVAVNFPGQCYGGGKYVSSVLLFPNQLPGNAKVSNRQGEEALTTLTVPPPTRSYDRLLNDVGMAMYRAGKLAPAVEYFEGAFTASMSAKAPYLLAQFNRAATLCKLGEKQKALDALAVLLSFSKERERFRPKVKTDSDFKALWDDRQLQTLLADDDCCLDRVDDRASEGSRSRTVRRYREGESKVVSDELWSWGRKTRESFEDGTHRSWDQQGTLIGEGSYKNGNGWTRHYHSDGTLSYEEHYVGGKKREPDGGNGL